MFVATIVVSEWSEKETKYLCLETRTIKLFATSWTEATRETLDACVGLSLGDRNLDFRIRKIENISN